MYETYKVELEFEKLYANVYIEVTARDYGEAVAAGKHLATKLGLKFVCVETQ